MGNRLGGQGQSAERWHGIRGTYRYVFGAKYGREVGSRGREGGGSYEDEGFSAQGSLARAQVGSGLDT